MARYDVPESPPFLALPMFAKIQQFVDVTLDLLQRRSHNFPARRKFREKPPHPASGAPLSVKPSTMGSPAPAASKLFSSFTLRSITLPNRIAMSPMCQYSCTKMDGVPTDHHFVHLLARAFGKVPLIIAEATGVSPEGRISPADTGIWNEEQVIAWKRITDGIRGHGSVPAIQLAHAGRKASTPELWKGSQAQLPLDASGWEVLAPSPLPFSEGERTPIEMTKADIDRIVEAFADGAKRALKAGFDIVEIHNAHGYLLHEFLSPLANHRTDEFGGSLENRMRFPLAVAKAVREAWPAHLPVFVRISATDWIEGGWDIEQSITFCKELKELGIDFIDVSSGAIVPVAPIPVGPGFQVPLAARIRAEAGIPTGAVGLITDAAQAEEIIASGQADIVLLARALLRDPHWVLRAAHDLKVDLEWPDTIMRAKVPFDRKFA